MSNLFAIQAFVYLQLLDFLTTLVGFKLGAGEASPFIAKLIHATSPAAGVGVSKLLALAIGAVCLLTGRARLITWINYWYAALILWNLCVILSASSPKH